MDKKKFEDSKLTIQDFNKLTDEEKFLMVDISQKLLFIFSNFCIELDNIKKEIILELDKLNNTIKDIGVH